MKDLSLFDELSERISLRVNSCREDFHDESWIESKAHHDYDLWFMQSGTVRLQIAGRTYAAGPGDVVFHYPHRPYTATTGPEGCRFTYVHFDFGIGEQPRILNDFPLSGIVAGGLLAEESRLFLQTYGQYRRASGRPGSHLYLKGCLSIVMARIIELHGGGRYTGEFADGPGDASTRKPAGSLSDLQPVFRHIHDNLNRSVRMSELAAIAGVSEKYFIAYFKKALGITPGLYMYQVKMNRARDYLLQRKYSVQEIAGLLGYPDPFTFSKAFKKYYNVPPSRFV